MKAKGAQEVKGDSESLNISIELGESKAYEDVDLGVIHLHSFHFHYN